MNFDNIAQKLLSIPIQYVRVFLLFITNIFFLFSAYQFLLFFLTTPDNTSINKEPSFLSNVGVIESVDTKVNIKSIQQWRLFGANQLATDHKPEPKYAEILLDESMVETELAINLDGIIVAKSPENSYAIIRHKEVSDVYGIGDRLPGGSNVLMRAIFTNKVIISNNGASESIILYERAPESKVIDLRYSRSSVEKAKSHRLAVLMNSQALDNIIKISFASDDEGKLYGITLNPGINGADFKAFGLKKGDVLTAVDGVSFSDEENHQDIIKDLKTVDEAVFSIERNGREMTIAIRFVTEN